MSSSESTSSSVGERAPQGRMADEMASLLHDACMLRRQFAGLADGPPDGSTNAEVLSGVDGRLADSVIRPLSGALGHVPVAWFGRMHRHVYAQIGIPLENVEVTHWRKDTAA
jgi:hypothetical protein